MCLELKTKRVLKPTDRGPKPRIERSWVQSSAVTVMRVDGWHCAESLCPTIYDFLLMLNRQLRLERPPVSRPRLAACEIGGEVRIIIQDAELAHCAKKLISYANST